MTEQQRCRQVGRASHHAVVLEREVELDVLHSDTAIPTLEHLVYRDPSRIDAQVQLGETAPALACSPPAPNEPDTIDASIDPDLRNSAPGIRYCCISTTRGSFSALIAEPSTSPSRRTVLLVHGYMGAKESFRLLIPYLVAAGHRVCAIDLRGHSGTALLQGTQTDDDVRLLALGMDVAAIAGALGGEPVHLVGCSMGGLVAQEAALIDARSIATLTLVGSGPGAVERNKARELRWLSVALRVVPRGCVWRAMRAYQARRSPAWRGPVMDAEQERLLHHQFRLHSRRALRHLARELQTAKDRSGEVGGLGLRTHVVCGVRDNVWRPDLQRAMAERLNARLSVVHDAGHSPHLSRAHPTARALLDFFADADEPGQRPPATAAVPGPMLQRRPVGIANPEGSHEQSSAA